MDSITVSGIEAWGFHGVLPHEAELGQRFVVDLTVWLDLTRAAADDDLGATVDYGALATLVVATVEEPRAALVEAVAGRVADAVLAHDVAIEQVEVTVHKPSAPVTVPVHDVAVTITRSRTRGE